VSDTEYWKGTLTPVDDIEVAADESIKRILGSDFDCSDGADTPSEQLYDKYWKEFAIHNNRLYRVDKEKMDEYADIFNADDNGDGTYNFEVKFYNGGCCFIEAIDEALKGLTQ
jgi:hypothetical protein